jgi:hypothetical protein
MSLTKQNRTSSASNAVKSLAMTPIQRTVPRYLKPVNPCPAVRAFTIGSNVTLLPSTAWSRSSTANNTCNQHLVTAICMY